MNETSSPATPAAHGIASPDATPAVRRRAHAWLWRRYGRVYDALEGLTGYQEMLDRLVEATGPVQGRSVVEIGCGTGNLLTRFLVQQPASLLGIDANAAMLAPAHDKLGPGIAAGRVALRVADAVEGLTELPAGSVDVLVASNVLYALPDRPSFWRQAARVLGDGGRVVLSNPDRAGFTPALRQQWRTRGVAGFLDPRTFEVFALNVAIDALAATGRYAFVPWDHLATEAADAGLTGARLLFRCYGGPVDGMNVVGVMDRADPAG